MLSPWRLSRRSMQESRAGMSGQVAATSQGRTAHVLCVDDDPILRALIKSNISQHVAKFVEAEDGITAWSELRSGNFDLAFVDLDMPGLNGVDLIRCMRGSEATRHLPVVVITSKDDTGAMRQTLEVGATAYLTKPVSWSLFEPFVVHLLELTSRPTHPTSHEDRDCPSHAGMDGKGAALHQRMLLKLMSIQKLAGESLGEHDFAVAQRNIAQVHKHVTRAIALLTCSDANDAKTGEPRS